MFCLEINSYTWIKDSNELIDYEKGKYTNSSFIINTPQIIYRNNSDIKLQNKSNDNNSDNKLSTISIKDGKYYYCSNLNFSNDNNFQEMTNLSWFIYQGKIFPQTENKYTLSENDIIKIGKIILKIREIKFINKKNNDSISNNVSIDSKNNIKEKSNNISIDKNNYKNYLPINNIYLNNVSKKISQGETMINKESSNNELNDSYDDYLEINKFNNKKRKLNLRMIKKTKISLNKKLVKKCRICYSGEEDSILNPLIQPCSCSGSLKYIHYYCLLHWLSSKISIKQFSFLNENYFSIFPINEIKCELCKNNFPEYIKHKNRIYSLINFEKYNSENDFNYIIFDAFPIDKIINCYRYIIKFDNNVKKMILGRGKEANIILNDISISRSHCQISINNNCEVILNDLNSKFGTLVLIQNKCLEILEGKILRVQIGRSFLNFEIKEKFSLFNCCNTNEINTNISYELLNKNIINYNKKINIKEEKDNDDDDNDEIDIEYNKLKDKNTINNKIIQNNNNNSIETKNKFDLSLINQAEITNVSTIMINNKNNKTTIESEQNGTLNINRNFLNGIRENNEEDNKSMKDGS